MKADGKKQTKGGVHMMGNDGGGGGVRGRRATQYLK